MALLVGEQRQVVIMRKTGQLFVGREGQLVEIDDAVAARIDDDAPAFVPPDQVANLGQWLAVGQFEQRSFALADDQIIDFRKFFQNRRTERLDMHVAENNLDFRPALTNVRGDLEGIHETGSRCRKADHVRFGGQHDFGVLGRRRRRIRPEAIVQLHRVAKFFQPGGELHDADWRHAVGQHRKIRLPRNKIEASRMNEREAHGYFPNKVP